MRKDRETITDGGNGMLDGFHAGRDVACSKNPKMNGRLTFFQFPELYSHYFNGVNLAHGDF